MNRINNPKFEKWLKKKKIKWDISQDDSPDFYIKAIEQFVCIPVSEHELLGLMQTWLLFHSGKKVAINLCNDEDFISTISFLTKSTPYIPKKAFVNNDIFDLFFEAIEWEATYEN